MDPKLKIAEARKRRAALLAKANKLLGLEEGEEQTTEEIPPEVEEEFDEVMEEIKKLDSRITRLEQLVEAEVEEEDPPAPAARIVAATEPKITNREARIAFKNYVQRGIRQGIQAADHDTTTAAAIVPVEFEQQLLEAVTHENWLRALANVRSISTNRDVPVVTAASTAAYTAEGASLPSVDPVFTKAMLRPLKNVGVTKYTWELELLTGLLDFEGELAKSIGKSLAESEIKEMLTGAGTAGPQGVVNGSQKGADAAKDSLTADDLIDLLYSIKPGYRRRAVFAANGQTLAHIRKLKDSVSGAYLWQPSLAPGQPETLLGRPIYEDPNMPDIGTSTKPVVIFDPGFYVIGDRTGVEVQVLVELYAGTGEKGLITKAFNDGRLAIAESAKHVLCAAT